MTPPDNWRFIGASVQGTSHIASGLPCQDASTAFICNNGEGETILVAIAADGAGSACRADEGAQSACTEFSACIQGYFDEGSRLEKIDQDLVQSWLEVLKSRLAERAAETDLKLRDFATTLLVAIVGERYSVYFQIGDGAIVVFENGAGRVVFWPQSGEYVNTTHFATDDDVNQRLMFKIIEGRIDDLAIISDGLQSIALQFSSRLPHEPFFIPMFKSLRVEPIGASETLQGPLIAFLESPRINERTDDDKTLILATRSDVPNRAVTKDAALAEGL